MCNKVQILSASFWCEREWACSEQRWVGGWEQFPRKNVALSRLEVFYNCTLSHTLRCGALQAAKKKENVLQSALDEVDLRVVVAVGRV